MAVKVDKSDRVSPNCIYSLDDPKMSHLAKAMLVRLVHLDYDLKEVFYSNDSLANDLNISLRSAINALNELQKSGYISRKRKHASGTRLTQVNHKTIIASLFEKPRSNRHLAWLANYYKKPKKVEGRYES
jgi:DNA-binding GntR family transcriptional regulator